MRAPLCHYDGDRGWLTPEHLRECADTTCRGCRPCPKSHCALRGRCARHVEPHAGIYTCPRCIGDIRRRIRAIVDRYAELPAEAEVAGVNSEALNLHGPAASPEQYAARQDWNAEVEEARDWRRGWCDFPRPEDDSQHPFTVLGGWDMRIRDSYGPPTDLFITITRAADYLAGPVLDVFAHTREVEEFTADIDRCLSHLEAVLSDSRESEKGAPCPTCRGDMHGSDQKPPRLLKRYGHATDASGDTWHCPVNPSHWWSDADYRGRVDGDYLQYAAALTAHQIHEAFGIKPGSVRGWASLGKVAKRGRSATGLTLYDVAQARAMAADTRVPDVVARSASDP